MLSTPWSRGMGLRVPIVNAPMGGVAGGRLAAAVTAAGGLGMVGMGSAGSTSSLHAELPHVAGTFGIGLVDWVIRKEPGLLDAALAARPVLLSVSFGTDLVLGSARSRCRDRRGHPGLQQCRGPAGAGRRDRPAGGARLGGRRPRGCDDRHPAAARCRLGRRERAGAGRRWHRLAAQPGSRAGRRRQRRLAGHCAVGLPGSADERRRRRRALVAARETDTASTRVFDIVRGLPWSKRFPSRVLRNDFVERWSGQEDALADDADAEHELAAATAADDRRTAPVDAGQGVGMVTGVAPVSQVIDRLCDGRRATLVGRGVRAAPRSP